MYACLLPLYTKLKIRTLEQLFQTCDKLKDQLIAAAYDVKCRHKDTLLSSPYTPPKHETNTHQCKSKMCTGKKKYLSDVIAVKYLNRMTHLSDRQDLRALLSILYIDLPLFCLLCLPPQLFYHFIGNSVMRQWNFIGFLMRWEPTRPTLMSVIMNPSPLLFVLLGERLFNFLFGRLWLSAVSLDLNIPHYSSIQISKEPNLIIDRQLG